MEEQVLDQIHRRYASPTGGCFGILSEVQRQEGYIPRDVLETLSQKLDLPLSDLYRPGDLLCPLQPETVASNVKMITGLHGDGLPCEGAVSLLEALQNLLHLKGETADEDGKFSLTTRTNRSRWRSPGVSAPAASRGAGGRRDL